MVEIRGRLAADFFNFTTELTKSTEKELTDNFKPVQLVKRFNK